MRFFAIVFTLCFCGCISNNYPDPKDPAQVEEDCEDACANLEILQCDGWNGSPGEDEIYGTEDDVSCFETCVGIESSALAEMNPACVAEISSCDEMESCYQ